MDEGLLAGGGPSGVRVLTVQATTIAALRRFLTEAGALIAGMEAGQQRLRPADSDSDLDSAQAMAPKPPM